MKDFILPKQQKFAQTPTPLHSLPFFSQELGVELHVKRDDLTGFAIGGNKIRKLEFLLEEALSQKANTIITCGGIQSNHCRATAAFAARLGLSCHLILRGEEPQQLLANHLLDKIFGAKISYVSDAEYLQVDQIQQALCVDYGKKNRKAYFVPEGASNSLGVMGYISMLQELQQQETKPFDSIVCATGSGGTQAGLVVGKQLFSLQETKIFGVNVCYDAEKTNSIVNQLVLSTAKKYELKFSFSEADLNLLDGFIGEGYAKNTPEELAFLTKVARTEGILLDPVYSGKAFYGLYQTIQKAPALLGKRILFIHTGGAFGNFKYIDEWNKVLC